MAPTASIIIPTQHRADYLEVAVRSATAQARELGAEVLVVDDGPSAATRAVATRHGSRYVAHDAHRGLNAARNTGIAAAAAELFVFIDDDVEVRPGWLAALLDAHASADDDVGAFAGPIHPRFEDHRFVTCGREGPPVTFLDLGPHDQDVQYAWGANISVRSRMIERIGLFDASIGQAGDEQEWQDRLHADGGRVRYVAAAALDHRRAGDDARLRSLIRAAHARGRASRRYDAGRGQTPSVPAELRVLAGCLWHTVRRRCWMNGPVLAAHSAGRLREALAPQPAPARVGVDDFLSGRSGHVAGRRARFLRGADAALDLTARPRNRVLDRAAAGTPARQRVHVLAIDRPGSALAAALEELRRSRHDVTVHAGPLRPGVGKFARLRDLLIEQPPGSVDWLLVVDDDVVFPRGFLDRFLLCTHRAGLQLAQPAHRLHSHAAWPVTRRGIRPAGPAVRATRFVEIGPVTAFSAEALAVLLPFPDLRMGWGLDVHWGAVARERGWRVGVVDATPILHLTPVADDYDRAAATAEAQAFLADRPYITRTEAAWWGPARTAARR